MSKNIYLCSVDTVKARTGLHYNVDEKLVYPEIKTAQDLYLEPALGTALFNRIQQGIVDNNLSPDEKILLDQYITDALVYYVLMCLPVPITAQFYNKGLVHKTDVETGQLSMSEITDSMNHYKIRAEHYKDRLIRYLVANPLLYPLYHTYGGVDGVVPEGGGYESTFYLGDDDDCPSCKCGSGSHQRPCRH